MADESNCSEAATAFCVEILIKKIGFKGAKVGLWDTVLLIPAGLFFIFLLITVRHAVKRLRSEPSPIFTTFYVLVWVATSFSALRSIVAMLVLDTHAAVKILWVMLHFLLFVTAITVVILGLTFTNSASGVNIRRSLLISIPLGAAWSICQAVLEFKLEPPVRAASDITNSSQHSPESTSSEAYFLYGGLEFMLSESGFFVLVYCVPFVCVCTSRLHKLQLPGEC
jgi:hypothetical protein